MRQFPLTRAVAIIVVFGLGYLGLGVGLARLVLVAATGGPVGVRILALLAAFAALLVAARFLSPAPRPALLHLLLAPLPLSAITLVASAARAAFISGSNPPATLIVVTTALVAIAALAAWRLQARGFYTRRWFAR